MTDWLEERMKDPSVAARFLAYAERQLTLWQNRDCWGRAQTWNCTVDGKEGAGE